MRLSTRQAHPLPLPQAGGEYQRLLSPSRLREGSGGVGLCPTALTCTPAFLHRPSLPMVRKGRPAPGSFGIVAQAAVAA